MVARLLVRAPLGALVGTLSILLYPHCFIKYDYVSPELMTESVIIDEKIDAIYTAKKKKYCIIDLMTTFGHSQKWS